MSGPFNIVKHYGGALQPYLIKYYDQFIHESVTGLHTGSSIINIFLVLKCLNLTPAFQFSHCVQSFP